MVITQPNGTIVIETLDTPATRRAKEMARKVRLAQAAPAAPNNPKTHNAIAGPSQPGRVGAEGDAESELSSLTDELGKKREFDDDGNLDGEGETDVEYERERPAPVRQPKPAPPSAGIGIIPGGENFVPLEGGTLGEYSPFDAQVRTCLNNMMQSGLKQVRSFGFFG